MKKHILFTILALFLTMCVGFLIAARSNASFEQAEAIARLPDLAGR